MVATNLAYIGVLQFGTQKTEKEKHQCYIYLNRHATLLDTTTSAPAYHMVEQKEYTRLKFEFITYRDVEQYWSTMMNICDETRLNSRKNVQNYELANVRLHRKPMVAEVLRPKTLHEMYLLDNGDVPGDQCGAAGFDSALYVHLRLNWVRGKPKYNKLVKAIQKKITLKEAKQKYAVKKIISRPRTVKRGHFVRKLPPYVAPKRVRNVFYDEVDKKALRLMNSLRVTWVPREDHILLTCRLAILYLTPTAGSIPKVMITVRDILHWRLVESRMKTSRACSRRILYLLKKNKETKSVLYFCLAELRQNASVAAKYGDDFTQKLKKVYPYEKDYITAFRIHFISLVYQLSHMYKSLTNVTDMREMLLPDTVDEFHQEFKTSVAGDCELRSDPTETIEIEKYILGNLIHSSLCSMSDKTNYNIQLFEVYKEYNDETLRSAMLILRKSQMVSMNKSIKTKHLEQARSGSTMPLHLSITYLNQITTRIVYDAYDEAFQRLLNFGAESLYDNCRYQLTNADTGTALLLAELTTKNMIKMSLEAPELVIKMDVLQPENIASYERIYPRFREIIRHMRLNHKVAALEPAKEPTQALTNASGKKLQFHEEVTTRHNRCQVEILFKLNNIYLHIFCLIKSLGAEVHSQNFFVNETTGLCSSGCILQDLNPVGTILTVIKHFEREILNMKQRRDRMMTEYLHKNFIITEITLVYFFDRFLERHRAQIDANDRKDLGKNLSIKPTASKLIEMCEEILLEAPHNLNSYFKKLEVTSVSIASEFSHDYPDEYEEDLDEKPQHEKDLITRNPDIFLVNLGKMMIKLNESQDKCKIKFEEFEAPRCLLPVSQFERDELLQKIKDTALWPTTHRSLTELRRIMKDKNIGEKSKKVIEALLERIKEYGEIGVKAQDLPLIFNIDKHILQSYVNLLTKEGYVLRTGITNIIYVHYTCIRSWVVRSYNLKRLERESIPTDTSSLTNYSNTGTSLLSTPSTSTDQSEFGKRMADLDSEQIESLSGRRVKRLKTDTPTKFASPPRQTVLVIPMPWIRINGSLNRRVLDRWMGAILLHLIQHPGTTLKNLGLRFKFLSIMQIRKLLEILMDLKCVEIKVKTMKKPGLFSKYCEIREGKKNENIPDFTFINVIFSFIF